MTEGSSMSASEHPRAMTERDDERSTNEQIAELILSQTYEERVKMAVYIAACTRERLDEGALPNEFDTDYFATLLFGWADGNSPGEPS